MAMAACSCCCHAMVGMPCYLWRTLRSTRRVRRVHCHDDDNVEEGGGGWDSSLSDFAWSSSKDEEEEGSTSTEGGEYGGHGGGRRERRNQDQMRRSLRLRLMSFRSNYHVSVTSMPRGMKT
uniref:Uncharacterized protein n=1 Tax=Oryza sativa subsp. japonica TaxID=39947 RepID=Q2QYY7_ORYSJ|nr:hypothetical protein LOC_Os12g01150 [Oryza sativa Japonica Group]